MENYVTLSLETHLFFARIMKEHSLFLQAGFPCADTEWIEQAGWFMKQFEDLLREIVVISDGRVGQQILDSGEVVTQYTLQAENRTEQLSGAKIDSRITRREQELRPDFQKRSNRNLVREIDRINQRALRLLDGLIDFKQDILDEVGKGTLFTVNYPLLIEHIQREAKLYRATVRELMDNNNCTYSNLRKTENFWNRIMMEHALFIRGLLDPTEVELIETADKFAEEYQELLETARRQDSRALGMTQKALEETLRYRDFKAAGTEGILNCKIASIILPLLADHVLREANHYIRLLQTEDNEPCSRR
ncbi:MAG: DUF2935 domain-containing protein [Lachnospiraceae bacterium]|nr:DUF2935 domain-containing protein [Lachnospiraceae bacterium]